MLEFKSGWWLTPIVIAIVGACSPAATAAIVVAILIHELSHALAALTVGCRPRKLILGLFPSVGIENPHHRAKHIWIALAAPLVNLLLFVWLGFSHLPMWAAGQLIVFVAAVLPYPGSDSWQAFRSAYAG